MSIFNKEYTLKNRPEISLTNDEIWEVYRYCKALNGLDSLQCWLDNEAYDYDDNDEELKALIKYAENHKEDIDLGYDIWEDYMDFAMYDTGYDEMCAVVRCITNNLEK